MRPCLACGYDLSGHGEEPRCPECGLLNIPEGYRRQVWELVDSGKWFFSGPFSFFRKRPPGWWWALDRPDDLRRGFVFLVTSIGLSILGILFITTAASFVVVETTSHYAAYDRSDPTGAPVAESEQIHRTGWNNSKVVKEVDWDIFRPDRRLQATHTQRVLIVPTWTGLPIASFLILWLLLTWACPTFVGLATQIRKGLPAFARPPRTIFAAAAYESHRLPYACCVLALMLGIQIALLLKYALLGWSPIVDMAETATLGMVGVFAAAGWIGPLRSDYTKQLIRSRFHAARIIVMYALLLPAVFTTGVAALVLVIVNDW